MRFFKIYLKGNILFNVLFVLLSLSIGLISFKLTALIKVLYNKGILENKTEIFIKNFSVFIIIILLITIIKFLSHILSYKIHWGGMKNIKVALFSKVLSNDYSYVLESNPSGIWNDINLFSFELSKYYKSVIAFVGKLIECILFTYLVFKLNYLAGGILLVLIPLISLSNLWVNKKVSEVQKRIIQSSKESAVIVNETITSIEVIKTKNLYEFFLCKIEKLTKELHQNLTKNTLLITYWDSISVLIMNISTMIVIYFMIFVNGVIEIKLGEIIVLYSVMPLMANAYKDIFSLSVSYSSVKPTLIKVSDMFSYQNDSLGDKQIKGFHSLELSNVEIKYKNKNVHLPDLRLKRGERILITGESGIGKSSMFNIILGINKNYRGSVKINDINIKELDVKSIRNIFGISFQESPIFNMSIYENIKLGRRSDLFMDKIISTCQLDKQDSEKKEILINNNTVSGGEKSRIALAQCLHGNPDVILIDESLSSLDEVTEGSIMNSLLKDFSDKTILCISHRKSSKQYFNQVIDFDLDTIKTVY